MKRKAGSGDEVSHGKKLRAGDADHSVAWPPRMLRAVPGFVFRPRGKAHLRFAGLRLCREAKEFESPAGLFGALEVAQRQYDLRCEVEAYLKEHPNAAVVNLGCGLDDTFRKSDNGLCRSYNIDLPDVIAVRDELLPAGERKENIACDLIDFH